jgi:hypothetical protein
MRDSLVLLLGLMVFVSGVFTFWNAFHNIDIVHNDNVISRNYNISITHEMDVNHNMHTLQDIYIESLKGLLKGFIFSLFGMFLIGTSFRALEILEGVKKNA